MTIRELKDAIEDMDDDANVLLMSQSSWPFEYSVSGICTRQDIADQDEEDGTGRDYDVEPDREDDRGAIRGSDVFLTEGTQLRYGSKSAWSY